MVKKEDIEPRYFKKIKSIKFMIQTESSRFYNHNPYYEVIFNFKDFKDRSNIQNGVFVSLDQKDVENKIYKFDENFEEVLTSFLKEVFENEN